jgi:hypothetical protein
MEDLLIAKRPLKKVASKAADGRLRPWSALLDSMNFKRHSKGPSVLLSRPVKAALAERTFGDDDL